MVPCLEYRCNWTVERGAPFSGAGVSPAVCRTPGRGKTTCRKPAPRKSRLSAAIYFSFDVLAVFFSLDDAEDLESGFSDFSDFPDFSVISAFSELSPLSDLLESPPEVFLP